MYSTKGFVVKKVYGFGSLLLALFSLLTGLVKPGTENNPYFPLVTAAASISLSLLSVGEAIAGKQEKSKKEGDLNG